MTSQLRSYYCRFSIVVLATILLSTTSFIDAQTCNGILISYSAGIGVRLPPNVTDPKKQPYRFESMLNVLNNGLDELKSWKVFVGFQHDEFLVSASDDVLADDTTLPAAIGNGIVFAGYPMTDLKTAVETAGDLTQMQAQIDLVGTVFGVNPPNVKGRMGLMCVVQEIQSSKQTSPQMRSFCLVKMVILLLCMM